jgi:hypothetical protein
VIRDRLSVLLGISPLAGTYRHIDPVDVHYGALRLNMHVRPTLSSPSDFTTSDPAAAISAAATLLRPGHCCVLEPT